MQTRTYACYFLILQVQKWNHKPTYQRTDRACACLVVQEGALAVGKNPISLEYINRWRNMSIKWEKSISEKEEAVDLIIRNIDNWMTPWQISTLTTTSTSVSTSLKPIPLRGGPAQHRTETKKDGELSPRQPLSRVQTTMPVPRMTQEILKKEMVKRRDLGESPPAIEGE